MNKLKNSKERNSNFFRKFKKAIKEVVIILGGFLTFKDGIIFVIEASNTAQQKLIDKATIQYSHMIRIPEEEAIMILAKRKFALFIIAALLLALFTVIVKEFISLAQRKKQALIEQNEEDYLRKRYLRDLEDKQYREYRYEIIRKNKKDR